MARYLRHIIQTLLYGLSHLPSPSAVRAANPTGSDCFAAWIYYSGLITLYEVWVPDPIGTCILQRRCCAVCACQLQNFYLLCKQICCTKRRVKTVKYHTDVSQLTRIFSHDMIVMPSFRKITFCCLLSFNKKEWMYYLLLKKQLILQNYNKSQVIFTFKVSGKILDTRLLYFLCFSSALFISLNVPPFTCCCYSVL